MGLRVLCLGCGFRASGFIGLTGLDFMLNSLGFRKYGYIGMQGSIGVNNFAPVLGNREHGKFNAGFYRDVLRSV